LTLASIIAYLSAPFVLSVERTLAAQAQNEEVKIARWSGAWRKGNEVRVGVRLDDGRDGMLVAAWITEGVHPDSEAEIGYTLLIMGEIAGVNLYVPPALKSEVEKKLVSGGGPSTLTIKDISLF